MDLNKIQNLKNQALSNIIEAKTKEELEEIRISFLGRKGEITNLLKEVPKLDIEERKETGKFINEVKKVIEEGIKRQIKSLSKEKEKEEEKWFDVSIPGKKLSFGHLHPLTLASDEIRNIFRKIGFKQVSYPEIEWDWYAFEGLNMPKNHFARDEWETFFIKDLKNKKYGEAVLTPHTSSGQLREMKKNKPPIRMLNIAKCYRRQIDASHVPMFYQFETLVIDKGINITHLKGTLDYFVKEYFGKAVKTRIRPFHFQFTEPSFEVDISCLVCGGKGCKICKEGWLEIGGAGMVHPQVLKNGGVDPEEYTGFASGFGLERVLMMKYGIDDIRLLFNNDFRFLNQF
jgi:phenylalanyl-tRNA synthetase alpha chain